MTTGQRMKARRKEIGLSAEHIAELLNVSPATIYRYENGDIEKVPGDRLEPIAKALQTTPQALMGWEDFEKNVPSVPDRESGSRIKVARENAGYSQKELAQMIGVAQNTFHGYESGKHDPKPELLSKIADACDVTVDFLLGRGMVTQTGEKKFPSKDESAIQTANLSAKEQSHIKKYRLLDPYGKEAVDGVLDVESRRCEADRQAKIATLRESREQTEAAEEIAPEVVFICPGFSSPMSAGTGQQAGEEYPENYRLIKEPPRGTSYIAPIDGNSMEPTYRDGEKLFIHACTNIRKGQIGVFFMDGKQWVKELGDGVLISHNPKYEPRKMTEDIICQGLVLDVCDESYFE